MCRPVRPHHPLLLLKVALPTSHYIGLCRFLFALARHFRENSAADDAGHQTAIKSKTNSRAVRLSVWKLAGIKSVVDPRSV